MCSCLEYIKIPVFRDGDFYEQLTVLLNPAMIFRELLP